jgi:AraC-like DNA-binding protein
MQYLGYNERKLRGTFDFPIEFHHIESQHPQYAMPYHWHVEYEIIRILEGIFVIALDEKEFVAEKGDFVFINSGTLHGGIPTDCIYECIVFDMNMLMKKDNICGIYVKDIMNHAIVIKECFRRESSLLHQIIWNLFDFLAMKAPGYELMVQGCLYQMLGCIVQRQDYITDSMQTPKNHKRILTLKQVLEYIENSYANAITLEELSKTAGMSPKYFCRFFQEMTHKSPFDYLNYYRIERSCYHLLHTEDSITDVALNCGYNDLSYYIKIFKRHKGITPAKYKKTFAPIQNAKV